MRKLSGYGSRQGPCRTAVFALAGLVASRPVLLALALGGAVVHGTADNGWSAPANGQRRDRAAQSQDHGVPSASVAGAESSAEIIPARPTAEPAACAGIPRRVNLTGNGCTEDLCRMNWLSQARDDCTMPPRCAVNTCNNVPCVYNGVEKSVGYKWRVVADQTCAGGKRYYCKAELKTCKCKCQ